MSSVRVEEITSGPQTCPYCKATIRRGEPTWTCPRCATVLHAECLQDNKGCTSLGCEAAAGHLDPSPEPSLLVRLRAWLTFERAIWSLLAILGLVALAVMGVLLHRVGSDDSGVYGARPSPPRPLPVPVPVAPVGTRAQADPEIARLQREIERQARVDREERAERARLRAEEDERARAVAAAAEAAPVDTRAILGRLAKRGPYPAWLTDPDARDSFDLKVNGDALDPRERARALSVVERRLEERHRVYAREIELARDQSERARSDPGVVADVSTWTYAPDSIHDPDVRRHLELQINSWREMDPVARERTAREIRELEAKIRRRIHHPSGR